MKVKQILDQLINTSLQFGKNGFKLLQDGTNKEIARFRNAADSAFARLKVLRIQTSNSPEDVPTLLDVRAKVIRFSFTGTDAPAPGANTNKYGICHTTGGSYTVNDVVYDDGSNLIILPRESSEAIYAVVAVSGTLALTQGCSYVWNGSAYVLTGDGAATDSGFEKFVNVDFTYSDTTKTSTASIPVDASMKELRLIITTAWDGTAPNVSAALNGSTPLTLLTSDQGDLKDDVDTILIIPLKGKITSTTTGNLVLTINGDSSTTGAASVEVYFGKPLS